MHPLTKITDTLFCVEVEKDAHTFCLDEDGCLQYKTATRKLHCIDIDSDGYLELLGYCTDKEISFPIDEFLEKIHLHHDGETGFIGYKDYANEENCFVYSHLNCRERSFRSLLLSKGLYFDNPNGCEPELIDFVSEFISDEELRDAYKHNHNEWQSLEAAKITGKLVFFKLLK